MRILRLISGGLSSELTEFLLGFYPEGLEYPNEPGSPPWGFDCKLYEDDSRLARILEKLSELKYSDKDTDGPSEEFIRYRSTRLYIYDSSDYESCEWLAFGAKPLLFSSHTIKRDRESGQVVLPCNLLSIHQDAVSVWGFGGGFGGTVLVPDRVASVLKEAGGDITGLKIRHVIMDRPLRSTDPEPGWVVMDQYDPSLRHRKPQNYTYKEAVQYPWWELNTDAELPPVSTSMELITGLHDEPIKPGMSKTDTLPISPDGVYPVELHYRRSDMDKFPRADVARSWERRRGAELGTLIVSQKFYRWWISKGFQTGGVFVPVRIDEGL